MMERDSFYTCCLDEIALEGLDGITTEALWTRLQTRPKFPFALDGEVQSFIWKSILSEENLQFFELPVERPPLKIYNRYDYVDPEFEIVVEPDHLEDIYPVKIINDNGLRGSCATYHERKDITQKIRDSNLTLDAVNKKWGSKLVIVASQRLRVKAIIGPHATEEKSLTDKQYCILERIGRSRYLGLTTQGKYGTAVIEDCAKTMFYYRKWLLQKNLITKQVHFQKDTNGHTTSGSLLHLTRFYVLHQSKMEILIKMMCEKLALKPNKREVFPVFREEMGLSPPSFKKLLQKPVQNFISVFTIPYNEMYPGAEKRESHTKAGKMKVVRCVELIKPYESPDCIDEFEDDDGNDNPSTFACFDPSNFVYNRPILQEVYTLVRDAGPEGITAKELSTKTSFPGLEIRMLHRTLQKKNVILRLMQEVGRQRVSKYVAVCHADKSEIYQKFLTEKKRILEATEGNPKKKIKLSVTTEEEESKENGIDVKARNLAFELPTVKLDENFEPCISNKLLKGKSILSELKEKTTLSTLGTTRLSYKLLNRANTIIQLIQSEKMIDDITKISTVLIEKESQEGCKERIDKKSLVRLISKLNKDGYIKLIRAVLTLGNATKKLTLYCSPEMSSEDQLIRSTIEQAKLKYFGKSKTSSDKHPKASVVQLSEPVVYSKMVYLPGVNHFYGFEQKFRRMALTYSFLHYLIYTYEGTEPHLSKNQDSNHPSQYCQETSWKMFVPALPKHSSAPENWCFVADALLALPLSIFVRIIPISFKIEGIEEYLQDTIKRHYLVRQLPIPLRNALLYSRKYIFSFHEILVKLSFMGLVSFGPHKYKTKDEVFIFLHRRTKVVDTTIAKPSYLHIPQDCVYETTEYFLQTENDVKSYWNYLENVCINTPLGSINAARGQEVVLQDLYRKPEMIEASRNKDFDEVKDNSKVPGDGLGAGGLDSGLFAHLKRNWTSNVDFHQKLKVINSGNSGKNPSGQHYLKYLLDKKTETTDQKKRLTRLQSNNLKSKDLNQLPVVKISSVRAKPVKETVSKVTKKKKPKSVVRIVQRKRPKIRKAYYDEKDMAALEKMKSLRVNWTPYEDSILLLNKVASCFLDPYYDKMVVPASVVRDILHEMAPEVSADKTSRACQRRIRFMMGNQENATNVSVFLGEVRQDQELVEMFNGPKPSKRHEKEWEQMFRSAMKRLLVLFKKHHGERCQSVPLPKSVDELRCRFSIVMSGELPADRWSYQEPRNIVDIYFITVTSVIMAAMAAQSDGLNWSMLLYKIYEQFPDTLVRSAAAKLRHNAVICRKKGTSKSIHTHQLLTMSPFAFSDHFAFSLQQRYMATSFLEMASYLLKQFNDKQLRDAPALPSEIVFFVYLQWTGALEFSIVIPDKIVEYEGPVLNKEMDDGSIEQSVKGGLPKASRIFLYMLRQQSSKDKEVATLRPQDYVTVHPCDIKYRFTESLSLPCCTISSEMPLSIKSETYDKIIVSQATFLPVESSCSQSFIKSLYSLYEDNNAEDGVLIFTNIAEGKELGTDYDLLLNTVLRNLKGSMSLKQHLHFLMENFVILQVGVISIRYVASTYARPWLVRSLKVPEEFKKHLMAIPEAESKQRHRGNKITSAEQKGTSQNKSQNQEPVLESAKLPDQEHSRGKGLTKHMKNMHKLISKENWERVLFVARIWRKPDGSLNKEFFHKILCSVFSYVTDNPGITQVAVLNHFSSIIQPCVQITELLEILEEIDCIHHYSLRTTCSKSTLFSSQSRLLVSDYQPGDQVCYESTLDAMVNLSAFTAVLLRETMM